MFEVLNKLKQRKGKVVELNAGIAHACKTDKYNSEISLIQQNLKEVRNLQKVEEKILKRLNRMEIEKVRAADQLESIRSTGYTHVGQQVSARTSKEQLKVDTENLGGDLEAKVVFEQPEEVNLDE